MFIVRRRRRFAAAMLPSDAADAATADAAAEGRRLARGCRHVVVVIVGVVFGVVVHDVGAAKPL